MGRCLICARHAEKNQNEKRMQIVASHDLHFLAEQSISSVGDDIDSARNGKGIFWVNSNR